MIILDRFFFITLLLTLLFSGCTSEEDIFSEVSSDAVGSSNSQMSEAARINHWIYDEMNHYYFWRNDMPDSIACDFESTPKEFYESLLSPEDRFSYLSQKSASRGMSLNEGLGFGYQECKFRDGEHYLYVLYVRSEEAKRAGLRRGDMVKLSDNPSAMIRLHKYHLCDGKLLPETEIAYSPATRASVNESVQLDSVYSIQGKKIGYLCYLGFDDVKDIYGSFKKFKDEEIDELILDLRYNPGGYVSTCKKLCHLIVPENGYEKLFQQYSYNDIIARENFESSGDERTYEYFGKKIEVGGMYPGQYSYLHLPRIYILISSHSASASEATINSLRPYMEVVTIGEQSVGKGVGMRTLTSTEHNYALVPITFRYYNADGVTVPDEGIVPDYNVPDGYSVSKRDLGDIREPLLAKALRLIVPSLPYDPFESNDYNADDFKLIPVGEPSFVSDFKERQIADGYIK